MPKHRISPQASQANQLTIVADQLLYKSRPVKALTLRECLVDFINYLKSFNRKVVLAAHNGKVFDARILLKAFLEADLFNELQSIVIGFIDTLPMFKQMFPERKSYKQEELVRDCLKKSYDAHNGLEDVKSLKDLLLHLKPPHSTLASHTFTVDFVCQSLERHKRITANFPSFTSLVSKKVLSKSMAQKIAGSGLNLQQIRLIHARGGYDGLSDVLSAKEGGSSGRCCVTASKKVLRTLSDFLAKE